MVRAQTSCLPDWASPKFFLTRQTPLSLNQAIARPCTTLCSGLTPHSSQVSLNQFYWPTSSYLQCRNFFMSSCRKAAEGSSAIASRFFPLLCLTIFTPVWPPFVVKSILQVVYHSLDQKGKPELLCLGFYFHLYITFPFWTCF